MKILRFLMSSEKKMCVILTRVENLLWVSKLLMYTFVNRIYNIRYKAGMTVRTFIYI